MVARGLAGSRSEASRMIAGGEVLVGGAVASTASRLVGSDEAVVVHAGRRWVGRGAEKMEHALTLFSLDVSGRHVLDAGASTGGFTECLLHHGAEAVIAVDVGRNQLHERLRADARVLSWEGRDVRSLVPGDLPFPCSLVVADLSFISLTKVVPGLLTCASPEARHPAAQMLLLVKPQFEVGHREASRGRGVITDPTLHREAVGTVSGAVSDAGGVVVGVEECPVRGAKGNTEFLMLVSVPPSP